jgi:hypothetical protein
MLPSRYPEGPPLMTTQLPYPPPQQQPPAPAYSTAPPWATPAPAAPDATAGRPGMSPWGAPTTEHGQLLVPFPEELQNAARAEPPSWIPVVVWTALFGVFGAIAAAKRAEMARRGRNSPAPFWIAFGVTMVVSALLAAATVTVGLPVYLEQREQAMTRQVQSAMVEGPQIATMLRSPATSASCEPLGDRLDGVRPYSCVVALQDGRSVTMRVEGSADGKWTPVE